MKIVVRVIGVRFELNDPYICVIGKYVVQKDIVDKKGGDVESEYKPKLTIVGDHLLEDDE